MRSCDLLDVSTSVDFLFRQFLSSTTHPPLTTRHEATLGDHNTPPTAEHASVRATAVGRDAEQNAEQNVVLAGDPKGLVYYVMID